MLFIVIYHLLLFFVAPYYPAEPIYKGLQIPLHIGVILFVLISGYFGIKCKFRGLFKLIMMVAVYYLPIALSTDLIGGGTLKQIIKDCFFISHSPYWFIRTYICLYIFSPVLNHYLNAITHQKRIFLIVSLGFISIYLGTSMGDSSLANGKNLVNFSLLYVLGDTLRVYKDRWEKWTNKILIPSYLFLNISLVSLNCIFSDSFFSKIIWRLSFPYCSPLLIFNALLFFIILAKHQLHSRTVNIIASSVFSVYLLHCEPFIEKVVIGNVMGYMFDNLENNVLLILINVLLIGVLIMIVGVLVDKLLFPIWKVVNFIGDKLDDKLFKVYH